MTFTASSVSASVIGGLPSSRRGEEPRPFDSPTRQAHDSLTVASAHDEELIIRDLDLDLIAEVRNTWQFYRDRRPDAYADLTRP